MASYIQFQGADIFWTLILFTRTVLLASRGRVAVEGILPLNTGQTSPRTSTENCGVDIVRQREYSLTKNTL